VYPLEYPKICPKDSFFPAAPLQPTGRFCTPVPKHHGKSNEFISSFSIERKWIFETVIDIEDIVYSICPYKYTSTQLKFTNITSDCCVKSLFTILNYVLIETQIYYLEICQRSISIEMLNHMI
jgi:hypothetical protein